MNGFDFSRARINFFRSSVDTYRQWKMANSWTCPPSLTKRFYDVVRQAFAHDFSLVTDRAIAFAIIKAIQSQFWDQSCMEHSMQVGALARVIGEELKVSHLNKLESAGLLHDVGRCASHDPWIHGLAGVEILTTLGFDSEFTSIAYAHLEAGAALLGATPENWPQILEARKLEQEIDSLPSFYVIIAVADMAKKEGKICDPMEGVFESGLRRLSERQRVEALKIDPSQIRSRGELLGICKIDPKMGMYLGLCFLLKERLAREGIVFEGENGVITKAQKACKEIQI